MDLLAHIWVWGVMLSFCVADLPWGWGLWDE